MKRKMSISAVLMLVILTAAATFNITFFVSGEYYSAKFGDISELEQKYAKFREVSRVVEENFVGEYDFDAAMDTAMAGFVNGLGDQWSGYNSAEETEIIKVANENAYVGVGITIPRDADNLYTITKVVPGGAADKAGILPFDVITHVDGVAVDEIGTQDDVVNTVRGVEGTQVTLTVLRAGQSIDFSMKRASVFIEQVEAKMLEDGIGYMSIAGFDKNVDVEFAEKLAGLINEGARGFIFDVRMNPGGALNVMVNILNNLLPEGNVISVVSKAGETQAYNSNGPGLDMPMAVLINEYSISAAEFFAAAMQEYGVAQIVGAQTGGKGYAQMRYTLSDGSSVNLSVLRYYTPKGVSLVDRGVTPDYPVEMSEQDLINFYYLEPGQDTQLQKAIEIVSDEISALPPLYDEQSGEDGGDTEQTTSAEG